MVLALLLDVGRDRVGLRALPAPEIPRRGEVADTHGGRGGFVAHATSRAAWWRGELEAGVAASVGLLPEPSGGFVVGGGVSVGQRFTLRARGWWLASRRVLHEDGRGAETSALGLTFELCTRLGGIERFDAEGCAGAAAGWLRVDAVGLSDGVQGESLPTAAMRTALRVRWRFGAAWLALALGAEAAVGQARLVRDQGRATEREIHRVGEVLGRGELLVGTGFPSEP
ncbi:MAG: hypothetical protein NZ898_15545 [Myxococcota bacterium]|nr:hypothetical protein [Myxococcota bacterium]MDW8361569.1 hypothetical protein [Myxococcales bacterium]